MSQIFFDFVICEPTYSPIGVIDISAPRENSAIPTIIITAPNKNDVKLDISIGAMVKHNTNIIKETGNTDLTDSLSICLKAVECLFMRIFLQFMLGNANVQCIVIRHNNYNKIFLFNQQQNPKLKKFINCHKIPSANPK